MYSVSSDHGKPWKICKIIVKNVKSDENNLVSFHVFAQIVNLKNEIDFKIDFFMKTVSKKQQKGSYYLCKWQRTEVSEKFDKNKKVL